jgi:hypothetical protein
MNKILSLALLILSYSTLASEIQLKVGDVLLQPLKCWACSLIEAEEETIYSHIGVVLAVGPEVIVAESFGKVRKLTLVEFNAKTEPGQKLSVLRFRNDDLSSDIQNSADAFMKIFQEDFEGAKYDHDFLWNNLDELGQEKYYCSELVSKLFQALVGVETPRKRMHFQTNREQWMTFFKGNIPDNQWGNSPGDFERSELFYQVGEL